MSGVVPGGFGQVADGVDHHEGAFPAIRAVMAADPAVLQVPVRQLGLQPSFDLGGFEGLRPFACRHGGVSSVSHRTLNGKAPQAGDEGACRLTAMPALMPTPRARAAAMEG